MPTALNNGLLTQDTRAAAAQYLELGVVPIPLPLRSKAPQVEAWQNLRTTPGDLDRLFPPGQALNIGVLLGGRPWASSTSTVTSPRPLPPGGCCSPRPAGSPGGKGVRNRTGGIV
jgi:hypothetical protein